MRERDRRLQLAKTPLELETVASLSIANDDARRTRRESMQVADAVKTLFAHLLHLLLAQIQSLPETVAVAAAAAVEA